MPLQPLPPPLLLLPPPQQQPQLQQIAANSIVLNVAFQRCFFVRPRRGAVHRKMPKFPNSPLDLPFLPAWPASLFACPPACPSVCLAAVTIICLENDIHLNNKIIVNWTSANDRCWSATRVRSTLSARCNKVRHVWWLYAPTECGCY